MPHYEGAAGAVSITASLATADEDSPWASKMLLSLDGGGIRGYSSLLILKRLMDEVSLLERSKEPSALSSAHSIWNHETAEEAASHPNDYLPCHYFDYIGGTSTGGLIAVMLSRLRMSVDQCIGVYKDLGKQVFGRRARSRSWWNSFQSSPPSPRIGVACLRKWQPLLPSPEESEEMFWSDDIRCRTIVCGVSGHAKRRSSQAQLLRSYVRDDTLDLDIDSKNCKPRSQSIGISTVDEATVVTP
ncbi:MAG: hypothetical protein LQ340_006839 [Diploschistes diacapsis]|nr:MAG: hypothetical protein LQ340_006839 [Diploschistes diacapsis]